jgi:hypothetical protein
MKTDESADANSAEAISLKLPGKRLFLTPLLRAKKFRHHKKAGTLAAWRELEKAKLGYIKSETTKARGTVC